MVQVHPQDTVDVPLAARRSAVYDCQLVLDEVRPLADAGTDDTAGDLDDAPLGRLAAAVDELVAVRAQLQFAHDDYGRPVLKGRALATVVMPCQRCLEAVETDVVAELEQVIWFGDEPPSELMTGTQDVMLSRKTDMSFAALLEDDLLLALPQKVCEKLDCEHLPALAYPAPGYTSVAKGGGPAESKAQGASAESGGDLPDDRQRPFAGLGDLLKASDKGRDEGQDDR